MFGSEILEVAIGLAFVYLLLSLVCSVMNEWIAGVFSMRAKNLEVGIQSLFSDGTLTIHSLGKSKNLLPRGVKRVNMLGESSPLRFEYTQEALAIRLPEQAPHELGAYGFKIRN